jgi:hypothetical protein
VTDTEMLKLVLGLCLIVAGALTFSLWHEHLKTLKDEEKTKYLMYNLKGGSWIFSVFFVCSGAYCLLEPFFGPHSL